MTLYLHTVHSPLCKNIAPAEGGGTATLMATWKAEAHAVPHSCLAGGFAYEAVVQVTTVVPPHAYVPGKMHPVGMRKPLCRVCRNPERSH